MAYNETPHLKGTIMNRVVLAVAILAASFALQHYADKKLEAKFCEVLNKKAAEQNAPAN
nr:MAG TPA: hypothetical protein [Caudoviricetes sp.]